MGRVFYREQDWSSVYQDLPLKRALNLSTFCCSQTFKIFIESFLTHKDAECFVYIDGQKITSMAVEAYGKEELAGLYEDRHRLRPFMFSVLPTTGMWSCLFNFN